MTTMKKRSICGLMAAMLLLTTACGGSKESSTEQKDAPQTEGAEAELTEWEKSSGIFNTDETEEELYELAKQEGSVTLYSISSRCGKVANAFNAKYPGVVCTAFDISGSELLEKVTREYEAGRYVADVVHYKDQDGSIYAEYVESNIFYNYRPEDILSHVDDIYKQTSTPLYIEMTQLFYNGDAYPDKPPVTNIWEVTQPEWKGRVMMQNILNDLAWASWATGFCVGDTPAMLEDAYKDLTGEDLVLSEGCENAGYEFLKRLYENEPIFTSSSDDVAEGVGTRGQSTPPIGFASSTKLRKNKDNNWCLVPINLEPTVGIPQINSLYVVNNCQHPNAAKLLIRFMMGGIDGDTSGNDPFNTLGGWPVRDDIEPAEGSVPLEDWNLIHVSTEDIYYNINNVRDFWTTLG